MKYEELKINQSVWWDQGNDKYYNDGKNKPIVIAAKFDDDGEKYIVLKDQGELDICPFDHFKNNYSLSLEDSLKKYSAKEEEEKKLISEVYELEKLFIEKTKELRVDHDILYISKEEIICQENNQRFKEDLRKMCLMVNVPKEFFDYYTRSYHTKSSKDTRSELLEEININES